MRRVAGWLVGVVVVLAVLAGLGVLIVPHFLLPDERSAAREALTALRDAGTVTVTLTDPAPVVDSHYLRVKGTARRSTRGAQRIDATFAHLNTTSTSYEDVRVRVAGGTTWVSNYGFRARTGWFRLSGTDSDPLLTALAATDPTPWLRLIADHPGDVVPGNDSGTFHRSYSFSCTKCTTTDFGLPAGAHNPTSVEVSVDFDLDLHHRPTSITTRTKINGDDESRRLDLTGYGEPLTVPVLPQAPTMSPPQ
jgi:hypothetical protein